MKVSQNDISDIDDGDISWFVNEQVDNEVAPVMSNNLSDNRMAEFKQRIAEF